MKKLGAYEKCKQYIESHSGENLTPKKSNRIIPKVCITISRETGAGASSIGLKLIETLQQQSEDTEAKWAFFNKSLIEKVLEDHNLPKKLGEYMKEDKSNYISSAVNELLGLHPGRWTLIRKTTETILQLAEMGNVVIVGRGANVIASGLKNCFHIRLVAPLEIRINNIMIKNKLSAKAAADYIRKEDTARRNYLKAHFFKEIDDPTLYHLVVNTGFLSFKETTLLISNSVFTKYPLSFR